MLRAAATRRLALVAASPCRRTLTTAANSSLVTTRYVGEKDEVAVLTMDDGKMNAFSHEMIHSVNEALDAANSAGAIVLTGNQKAFSAGFDLSIMGTAPSPQAAELLNAGGEMLLKMMALPKPLVMAVPGHALALGAIVLLAGDVRIGARNGKAKIGTNEVHIGLPLPSFALPLIRSRLSPLHLTRAATLGTVYNPEDAVATGYLDVLAEGEQLEEVAIRTAASLAQLGLQGKGGAFHTTKLYERREVLETCAARLASDVAHFTGAPP